MAYTQTLTIATNAGNRTITKTAAESGGQEINISESIPADQSNLAIACAFDKDKVKMVFISATVAMTLETNDGTTPDDVFTLIADEPTVVWWDGCGWANPFTEDVVSLFVTNTVTGTLTINILVDPT